MGPVALGAVGMLAAREIQWRWRRVVVLTLLVGLVGSVVLAASAGARRSDTALARFNAASRSADVALLAAFGYTPTHAQLSALRHSRNVAAVAMVRFYALRAQGAAAKVGIGAAVDGAMGNVVDRARLVAGRQANPAAADELTIGESLAARLHQRVPGHLDVASYTPAQLQTRAGAPAGPRLRLRIVGIVRRPSDLGDLGATGAATGLVVLTPAFNRAYLGRIGNFGALLAVRTRHGATDVPGVVAAARPIFARSGGFSSQGGSVTADAQSAVDVLTLALWVFAGVAALAGLVTIGFMLTREISLANLDPQTLRALGLTRVQRVLVTLPLVSVIAGGGAIVALVGAVAASPLLPIGVARRADPDLGLHFDAVVLVVGLVALAVVVGMIAFVAAVRENARSTVATTRRPRRRASRIVETAARLGLPPAATSGLRMALEPGSRETAGPVRWGYLGTVFGVIGVIAVLVFATSLDHLVATPGLYGWTWDFSVADATFTDSCGHNDLGLSRAAGVAAVAAVCYDDIQLGGHPMTGWGFTRLRGPIDPEIVAGRAPRTLHEVALGSVTLHDLGKSIGGTVSGRGGHGTVSYRIVGRAVFPVLGDPLPLADGAAFTSAGLSRIFDPNSSSSRYLVGRFTPGVDRVAVETRIAAIPGLGRPAGSTLPPEIVRVQKVGRFPAALAGLLGGLALISVGHALVTSVRRRRRDLAILKTLGFNRGQIGATVAWQATTLAAIGLLVGVPVGVIFGSVVWRLVADGLGVPTSAEIPPLALLLVISGTVVLVNLIAYLPSRAAQQTRVAVTLRSQ